MSALRSIEDVVERTCSPAGWRIHLAGWCEAAGSLRSQHLQNEGRLQRFCISLQVCFGTRASAL